MVFLMTNGEGMRGGRLHDTIAAHPFVGERRTAPKYRFFSVRDEFPGILPVGEADGGSVRGELFDVPLEVIRAGTCPRSLPSSRTGRRRCRWCCGARSAIGTRTSPSTAAGVPTARR